MDLELECSNGKADGRRAPRLPEQAPGEHEVGNWGAATQRMTGGPSERRGLVSVDYRVGGGPRAEDVSAATGEGGHMGWRWPTATATA